MRKVSLFLIFATLVNVSLCGQNKDSTNIALAVESRVTNVFQGGYELGVFYNTNSNFSFGIQYAAQNLEGTALEAVFESSDYDAMDVRLTWLFAAKARYHLKEHKEGFYFELSSGYEQFRVTIGDTEHRNENGFVLPSVGYLWHPWGTDGLYINPNVGYIYAFGREPERVVNNVQYELNPFFPSAAISIGWKFN